MAFATFAMFDPDAEMVQVSAVLFSSVKYMSVTLRANDTLYELQYSHSSKIKLPQRIPPSLAS